MSITRQRLNKLERVLKEMTHRQKCFLCLKDNGGYQYKQTVYKDLETLKKKNGIEETDQLVIIVWGDQPKGILKDV